MKKNNLILLLAVLICFIFSNYATAQSEKINAQMFNQQKKNVIKFNVLSAIALEHIEITYERAIKSRQSIEVKMGLIGPGLFIHEKRVLNLGTPYEKEFAVVGNGMFFAGGYKFFISNLVLSNTRRKTNILQGWYLQPELIAGFYTRNKVQRLQPEFEDRRYKQKVNYQAALVNLGAQGVIKNKFVFDLFVGLGIGNDDLPDNTGINFGEIHRGLYKSTTGNSFASKAGIKIALLF